MLSVLNFFNTPQFLFITILITLTLKSIIIALLIPQMVRSRATQRACLFLILILVGSMIGEISWGVKLSRLLFFNTIPYSVTLFFIRLSWAFLVLQYQSLALFVKSLINKKFLLTVTEKSMLLFSSSFFFYFLYLALFDHRFITPEIRHAALVDQNSFNLEIRAMQYGIIYILCGLILPSIYCTLARLRARNLPKILHHQLTVIVKYLLMPYLVAELLLSVHFQFPGLKAYTYAIVGMSAMLITYIVYYCIRHVMDMRFLNFTAHVESPGRFNFVDDFKVVLEQLSFASSTQDLAQITGIFFKQAFGIVPRKTQFFLRDNSSTHHSKTNPQSIVEEFLANSSSATMSYINTQKIMLYDELLFSDFYEQESSRNAMIHFLEVIDADIFLPIFEKDRIIGFISVESNARPKKLYSNIERDEMIVFARYLSNVINLLQNRNLEALIMQEKELREELYKKQQEINYYKEGIRSFFKNAKHKEIGIIFYKYRRFIFANQTAREMVKVNVNIHEGHPVSRALRQVARSVEDYKSPQTMLIKDHAGTRFIITGVANIEQNNVILTISYPDVSDIIAKQIGLLQDAGKWDYLLYLETTKPGQLINQLIPANGETLLNFKINLLQIALSKKATLLEIQTEDVVAIAELLHHISGHETLVVLELHAESSTNALCTKLFGINPALDATAHTKPLLEKLNENGTLFLQNIEHLDLESQEYLAEFIQYGYYRTYKSEQKNISAARIICSSGTSLEQLVHEGAFLPGLLAQLKKTCLHLPALDQLPYGEFNELAQGYREQAIKNNDYKNLLEFSEKEAQKLLSNHVASLKELKSKVHQILLQKSKKNNIEQEIQFDPAYEITDPELIQASRLGKHALRDHKIMLMLWSKFKNQNKIATFLGVNRSSVNRRCKEYNLETL